MTTCRCGQPYGETVESRLNAVYRCVGDDDFFSPVFCSVECWNRYEKGCFFCGGTAHPATGHAYSTTALACRQCFVSFFSWYRARMHNPIAQIALEDRGDCTCPFGGPATWEKTCEFCKGYP